MQANIVVSVIVENAGKVLFVQTQSKSHKLPSSKMQSGESPIDTARRVLKELKIHKETEIKYLVGIYSLLDSECEENTLIFAFVAQQQSKIKVKKGELEIISRSDMEKVVEEEKQLEDATVDAVVLRDYLQGEKYPKDIIKHLEEVKL